MKSILFSIFFAESFSDNDFIFSVSPERTRRLGELIAASEISSFKYSLISFSPDLTESILPGTCCCISFARIERMKSASSKLKTSAIQAATYSPTLCPIIEAGLIPLLINN